MAKIIRCKHCKRLVPANPRVKNQRYCGSKECQQARKSEWHRKKMKSDPYYAQRQNQSRQRWCDKNRDYWKNYRNTHTEYADRNRELQKQRDQKRRRRCVKMDASDSSAFEMDASGEICVANTGGYAIPDRDLAKMDASKEIYILIPISSENLAKMDKIDIRIG